MNQLRKRILTVSALIGLPVLLLALGFVWIQKTGSAGGTVAVSQNPVAPVAAENQTGDDYWTVAVLGLNEGEEDGYSRNISQEEWKAGGLYEQFLLSVNKSTGEIRVVSLPGELYLRTDSPKRTYGTMSQAYLDGGVLGNQSALGKNLDLTIDGFVTLRWNALIETVNILGGVDADLTVEEFQWVNSFITETVVFSGIGSRHIESYGRRRLDGVQAAAYMRMRLSSPDTGRGERIRVILEQVIKQMKTADQETLNQISEVVLSRLTSDVGPERIQEIMKNMGQYTVGKSTEFPFVSRTLKVEENKVYTAADTLEFNVTELHRFLYGEKDYTCSDEVKQISEAIGKRR